MTDRDALIEQAKAWAERLERDSRLGFQSDAKILRALISLASPKEDAIGAAEGGVGQWVYRRIEVLMDAEPGTPEGTELAYLAAIAADVEEYGATGDHPVSLASPSPAQTPIPMVLYCPACGLQHIDAAKGEWLNPPHRSHLCAGCGHTWRPADFATEGVRSAQSAGLKDSPVPVRASPAQWPEDVVERAARAACRASFYCDLDTPDGAAHWRIKGDQYRREVRAALATLPPPEAADPELDATDFAHPAWWRGEEHSAAVFCQEVTKILDGKAVTGTAREPWETVRRRLFALVSTPPEDERVKGLVEALVDHNDLLRSAFQAAQRDATYDVQGTTNYRTLADRAEEVLRRHHATTNDARSALASYRGEGR